MSEGLFDELARVTAERDRLKALINTPEVLDFVKAVTIEVAHQRERWGSDHDAGKTDADWFWLLGYLGGKALHTTMPTDCNCFRAPDSHRDDCIEKAAREKKLHRIITVAAAACNWHAALLGKTNMRPGIATPAGEGAQ